VRKVVAGFLVGLGAGALVLGADLFFNTVGGGVGPNPLQAVELKTYDWRLASAARSEMARHDIALIEIDEFSLRNLEKNAGRWPWPRAVHSEVIDFLARAQASVIVYDVNFAEADTRTGFDYGATTWSGAESDRALIDSVKAAGNVILVADATYEAAQGTSSPFRDTGFKLGAAGIIARRVIFPPFEALNQVGSGLGHNLFILDSDGPLRHTVPFVRTDGRVLPSLGLAAALRIAEIRPEEVRLDGAILRIRDRAIPLSWRRIRTATGTDRYLWALVNFRGPALLPDLKTRPYARYSFWDVFYSEEQILAGVKANIDPSVFQNKIVFVGVTASGLHDVF